MSLPDDSHDPEKFHRHWQGWKHHGPPPFMRRRGRGFLFFRLFFVFGFLAFFLIGILVVLYLLFNRPIMHDPGGSLSPWIGTCLTGVFIIMGMGFVFRTAFRGIARPMENVMDAADRLAAGDLSARVPEFGARDFRQLARSFNRMAVELERAEQQRRNLTADVAHELRTPLHIIQGNLEGVIDGVYEPSSEHLEATLDETRLLARLVEDLRTLSLAEAGQLPLELEPVNLAELLEDVQTSFKGLAETQGIALTLETAGKTEELSINGDYERMHQVLGNLAANGLRHTPEGGSLTLKVARLPQAIRISVSDTGVGIAAEDLPYIFDRFYQVDKARTRKAGSGSGLGLAIARQLVHAHGGTIEAASEVGKGTTFTLEFPT